jgi:hypothetical protein
MTGRSPRFPHGWYIAPLFAVGAVFWIVVFRLVF